MIAGVPGARKVPDPAQLFTIESLGGWKAVDKQFFERRNGRGDEDRAVAGGLHCQVATPPSRWRAARRAGAPAASAPRVARRRSARGLLGDLPVGARAAADRRAAGRRPPNGGLSAFWREVTTPEARRRDQAHAGRLGGRGVHQRRLRHADRLGDGARRVPRQAHRQRDDRSAVRAAHDRRRRRAARPVRQGQPGRHRHHIHARGGGLGAAVRDAAVRRALGAARAAGARRHDGGGRRLARREAGDGRSAASCCPRSRRRSSRAWRSASRGRSASSARWC